jgi:hypothetical protein
MVVRWEYVHTPTIHQHYDQVPLMNGITASPHSVVKKRGSSVITEQVPPATSFLSTSLLASPIPDGPCYCRTAIALAPLRCSPLI